MKDDRPKNIFFNHYRGLSNPLCPIIVEYGWIIPGQVAYELHRNQDNSRWGVQAVELRLDGSTREISRLRFAGDEDSVRSYLLGLTS